MEGIAIILIMAIITEALIEYAKTIAKAFACKNIKAAVTQLAAIVISVLLCFATGADLFALVGVEFAFPWIGVMLTGIIGSRGANYVSDFIRKLTTKEE